MRRCRPVAGTLLAALLLTVSACGGDEAPDTAGTTPKVEITEGSATLQVACDQLAPPRYDSTDPDATREALTDLVDQVGQVSAFADERTAKVLTSLQGAAEDAARSVGTATDVDGAKTYRQAVRRFTARCEEAG